MRYVHKLTRVAVVLAVVLAAVLLALPGLVQTAFAQTGQATLVGRALLPAATFANDPNQSQPAAQASALANRKNINGLKVPFDSQPVGGFVSIVPGKYQGDWYALTDGTFDTAANSGDFLLRLYTIQLAWATANGGDGTVSAGDWITFADPAKKVTKPIQKANVQGRPLTGADFSPRAARMVDDGTIWVAESSIPSLLHFDARGQLLEAPIPLGTNGVLGGLAKAVDGKSLLVAQRTDSQTVSLRAFDTSARKFSGDTLTMQPANTADSISGLTLINDHQALFIEQDNQEGAAAKVKQVFLVDLSAKPPTRTLLVDLLKISDPNNISVSNAFPKVASAVGLGATFKFPYKDVSSVYPQDGQTLVVVNDNNVPFGLGRSPKQADDSEFIAVQLPQTLQIDPKFALPH
ncbi:MAG TPA: esterase-like activity of phytase family protein [Aggregatilineales bacterium]|nr:esterase-like activity of phytase family protein [Aggregatilineales bacterium]